MARYLAPAVGGSALLASFLCFGFFERIDPNVGRLLPALICVIPSTSLGVGIGGTRSVRTFVLATFWCLAFMFVGLGNALTVLIETPSWPVFAAATVPAVLSLVFPIVNLNEFWEQLPLTFRQRR